MLYSVRRCDCPMTHGMTEKGFTWSKIFMCDEHGFICPFDGWQFKTPKELLTHIEKGEDQILKCEGKFKYGQYGIEDPLFELKMYIDRLINK